LLDPRLVDPGSTLIHVGAYDPISSKRNGCCGAGSSFSL